MDNVCVTAAQGVTLRGPIKLRLTKEQHGRRSHILGPFRKDGVYDCDGVISFKAGEKFGLEQATGRLSKADFEIEDAPKAKAAKKADEDVAAAGEKAAEAAA